MLASIPDTFLTMWNQHQLRPSSIHVSTAGTFALLQQSAAALDIPIHRVPFLPALEAVRASLMGFLSGHRP